MTGKTDLSSITEGDHQNYELKFEDDNGNAKDISGWTVDVTVKETLSSSDALISKTVTTHDDAANGLTSVKFTSSDTSGLLGAKVYDMQVTKADGTVVTAVQGYVTFEKGVTG